MTLSVLHRPLYGVGQAADVLRVPTATVQRWLDGYDRAGVHYEPVVRERSTGDDVVTWGEFVELGYLREYRRRKVSLQQLRGFVQELRADLDMPYPLAHAQPFVSNKQLVLKAQEAAHVPAELVMVRFIDGQLQLAEPAQAFYDRVEFNDGVAGAVRPAGRQSSVLVSPDRAFGMPAVAGRNVRTEVLFELWQAGDAPAAIAEGYELSETQVNDALVYESRRRGLSAA